MAGEVGSWVLTRKTSDSIPVVASNDPVHQTLQVEVERTRKYVLADVPFSRYTSPCEICRDRVKEARAPLRAIALRFALRRRGQLAIANPRLVQATHGRVRALRLGRGHLVNRAGGTERRLPARLERRGVVIVGAPLRIGRAIPVGQQWRARERCGCRGRHPIGGTGSSKVLRLDAIRRSLRQLPSTLFRVTPAGPGVWLVEGAGFGHGAGLSQAGAIDQARRGWSRDQILRHYYRGTKLVPLQALGDAL